MENYNQAENSYPELFKRNSKNPLVTSMPVFVLQPQKNSELLQYMKNCPETTEDYQK